MNVTLTPADIRTITNALRHNGAECEHSLAWGVRHGCGACRALRLWLDATQPKGKEHHDRVPDPLR